MKISAAFRKAFRAYSGHMGDSLKFLVVEACITLAAFAPVLFLTNEKLMGLALLAVPFYLLLVLWARVNAAAAMRDALNDGRLFTYQLIEPDGYGKKLAYGLKRTLMLLFWSIPMIALVVTARAYMAGAGNVDGLTLMRTVKRFGGGVTVTGIFYVALILVATLILIAIGCAFHSGDRHAFVRNDPKLVKGHHGKIMLCWLCSLVTLLPLIIAIIAVIIRYLPALKDLTDIVTKKKAPPSTKETVIILAVGAVLTLPLLPLRSLIPAAFVDGLAKE